MTEREGVTKFSLDHKEEDIAQLDVGALIAWREILLPLGLIGENANRYGGLGFGNISQRTDAGFVITGSQTGHISRMSIHDFAEVVDCQLQLNKISSRGRVPPSSESMTHGTIYQCNDSINSVFHVHSPEIWRASRILALSTTSADIPYGTVEMADAVSGLIKSETGVFCMLGHEDGIVCYGPDPGSTGMLLINTLADAKIGVP